MLNCHNATVVTCDIARWRSSWTVRHCSLSVTCTGVSYKSVDLSRAHDRWKSVIIINKKKTWRRGHVTRSRDKATLCNKETHITSQRKTAHGHSHYDRKAMNDRIVSNVTQCSSTLQAESTTIQTAVPIYYYILVSVLSAVNAKKLFSVRYDTLYLRTLKSWRDSQVNLAHETETKKNL